MKDSSKNLLDAAIEMATTANEHWKKNISELINKGNLSAEEGKGILDSLEEKMVEGQKEYENFLKKAYSTISNSFSDNAQSEQSNTKPLEDRVVSLELKISLMAREMMAQKKLIDQLLANQQSD